MRIAIDARAYFQRTGIARYTRELTHAIIDARTTDEFLLLISDRHRPSEVGVRDSRVAVRVSRAGWLDGAVEQAQIEREVRDWGADVFHSIFPPLTVRRVPSIVTVFDLTPLSHPQFHQAAVVDAFRPGIRRAVANAACVVAISQATAAETGRRFPRTATRTRVVGVGLPASFLTAPPAGRRAGVLFVGTIEPRKNVPLVVETARRLRQCGYRDRITIVGKPGWGGYDVAAAIDGIPDVHYAGYVSERTLLRLYRRAAIFLYPSTVEGFGLPVLEAMSQGALPLISSDPALREVVRNPELVIDVEDPDAVSAAVMTWSSATAQRTRAVRQLARHARRHTWQRAARQMARVYSEVQ